MPSRRAISRRCLPDLGLDGTRLGVEYDSYGLTYANGLQVAAALDGVCELTDASRLISAPARHQIGGGIRLRA